jgi:hypothetical protein
VAGLEITQIMSRETAENASVSHSFPGFKIIVCFRGHEPHNHVRKNVMMMNHFSSPTGEGPCADETKVLNIH